MPQIFVFTAGNPEARQHLVDSIQNSVDDAVVFNTFPQPKHEELKRIRREGRGFFAWGAIPGVRNTPTWKTMERGDYVLCVYGSMYHYVARVLAKYENERFARRVWDEDEDGHTWKYMYFLTEPIEVDQPLYEFEGYLHSRYQGFTRISNERLVEIEEDFGTIEGFVQEILDYEGEGLPDELLLAPDRSERVAEDSRQVDDVTHGTVDEGEISDSEGRKRIVRHVSYERSRRNRTRAIEIHGTTCAVCGFDFDEVYGPDYAGGYIQIHHIKPLSEHEGTVDPATDLVPLCANCHVMAHRRRTTVTPIEELRAVIEEASG